MLNYLPVNLLRKKVCVLLSGGLDSACLVAFYQSAGWDVYGCFCLLGQVAGSSERAAAEAIAKKYGIPLTVLAWDGRPKKSGEIWGRNGFLAMAALLELEPTTNAVAIGIHDGTGYSDCGDVFLRNVQALYDLYTRGTVRFQAPFLHWLKQDILEYARFASVPTGLTHSCEERGTSPCGSCLSCLDRTEQP